MIGLMGNVAPGSELVWALVDGRGCSIYDALEGRWSYRLPPLPPVTDVITRCEQLKDLIRQAVREKKIQISAHEVQERPYEDDVMDDLHRFNETFARPLDEPLLMLPPLREPCGELHPTLDGMHNDRPSYWKGLLLPGISDTDLTGAGKVGRTEHSQDRAN